MEQVKSDYIGRIVVGRKCWDRSGCGRFVRSFVYGVVLVVNVETFCLKMKYESAIIAAVICFVLVGVTEGRLSEIRVVLLVGVQPEVSCSRTRQNNHNNSGRLACPDVPEIDVLCPLVPVENVLCPPLKNQGRLTPRPACCTYVT